jgi:hypothetical protein
VGRPQNGPDPSIFGDEIAKKGADCFRETPDCCPVVGFAGFAVSEKGLNRPKRRGDLFRDGLADVEMRKCWAGDPTRDAPDFTGAGDEREGNTKDVKGGIRYDNTL